MKVALDVSAVPERLAGAGRYIAEVARRLPPLGVDTTLVCRHGDQRRWAEWSPGTQLAPIVPRARVPRLVYEAWSAGTSQAAQRCDLWHGPHYTMPHRGKTPTVVTIHDLTFFTNPEWHERSKVVFFRRAITYATQHADVLVSVSDFTARLIDEFFPQHAPVVVAPLGVDLERFSTDGSDDVELFRAHQLPWGIPYVFFVGTVEPRKGLDVLLSAFDEVSRREPTTELWLAGQAGWGLKEFDAQLANHRAHERIRRLGFVPDDVLPALLRQARVVTYPSRGEGFGLPVLEALACGASVVTSSDTVMAEVAGDTASLVKVGDIQGLSDSLSEVVASSDERRALRSVTARSRAERFTWDATMAAHLDAYHLALEGR